MDLGFLLNERFSGQGFSDYGPSGPMASLLWSIGGPRASARCSCLSFYPQQGCAVVSYPWGIYTARKVQSCNKRNFTEPWKKFGLKLENLGRICRKYWKRWKNVKYQTRIFFRWKVVNRRNNLVLAQLSRHENNTSVQVGRHVLIIDLKGWSAVLFVFKEDK